MYDDEGTEVEIVDDKELIEDLDKSVEQSSTVDSIDCRQAVSILKGK